MQAFPLPGEAQRVEIRQPVKWPPHQFFQEILRSSAYRWIPQGIPGTAQLQDFLEPTPNPIWTRPLAVLKVSLAGFPPGQGQWEYCADPLGQRHLMVQRCMLRWIRIERYKTE